MSDLTLSDRLREMADRIDRAPFDARRFTTDEFYGHAADLREAATRLDNSTPSARHRRIRDALLIAGYSLVMIAIGAWGALSRGMPG